VHSPAGDFTVAPVVASDGAEELPPFDGALVCTKAWQVRDGASLLARRLASAGFALPLGNGVEAPDELASVLGPGRALGGMCRIIARVTSPGVVEHLAVDPTIVFGELDDRSSERVEALRDLFAGAGIAAEVPPSVKGAMWEKLIFIAATSAVGAVSRATVGEIRAVPATHSLLAAAMRETWSVARALGVPVREDTVELCLAFFANLPAEGTASMQRDVIGGRPSELEAQAGAVVRFGRAAGVPTPVFEALYAALLPQERKARGKSRK
jgi:2-dehydropantoate 2-reductase